VSAPTLTGGLEDEVGDLYNRAVRERARKPRHSGRPPSFDVSARGDNPMCGDRVEVFANLDGDTIRDATFVARGCDISVASADLMAEAVIGHTAADTSAMFERFRHMVRTGECPACDAAMEQLHPLAGVHDYPSRMKCATLPWHALMAALDGQGSATSE